MATNKIAARALLYCALTLAAALIVGTLGPPEAGWALLAAGLAAQLLHHLIGLNRLERWSRQPRPDPEMEGRGAWKEIFVRLYRHEKRWRAELAQSQEAFEHFSAAIQSLPDGLVLLDAHDTILWCNITAEQQLGLNLAADCGQSIANLVRQPEFVAYLAAGDFGKPLLLRPEFKERVFSILLIPYGQARRLMRVQDVTQTDLLERMRRDFVANVSHELRTPLTVLAGFLETLQEIELPPEDQRRFLGMMDEQSERMQRIVRDLLTLSSLESAPSPENEIIDMASLLEKFRRDAEILSGGRHRITLDLPPESADLLGAESELISALGNLVSNAVRYTPEGGSIAILWHTDETGGEFSVRDNGIGIDPKHHARLTERFYRIDRGRSRDSGGTGLGLAIAKHALSRHQASLEISSTPGQGSTFTARFPVQRMAGLRREGDRVKACLLNRPEAI